MSPLLFEYVEHTLAWLGAASSQLLGLSCHDAGEFSEVTGEIMPVTESSSPFAYQFPDSFGALYVSSALFRFAQWVRATPHLDPLTPYSLTNR